MRELPDSAVLEWAADAAGVEIGEVSSLHEYADRGSGSYRLDVLDRGSGTAGQLVLKVPVPGFAANGSRLDTNAVTTRRDTFLRTALDRLPP